MAKLVLRKTLNGRLEPTDEIAREVLSKIGVGDLVMVEIRRARNIQHHRKFYALMALVFQNQERYTNLDELVDVVKVYVGWCEQHTTAAGELIYRPKSINFARMDQIEFDGFYDRVIEMILKRFLPTVTREDLERELLEFAA